MSPPSDIAHRNRGSSYVSGCKQLAQLIMTRQSESIESTEGMFSVECLQSTVTDV